MRRHLDKPASAATRVRPKSSASKISETKYIYREIVINKSDKRVSGVFRWWFNVGGEEKETDRLGDAKLIIDEYLEGSPVSVNVIDQPRGSVTIMPSFERVYRTPAGGLTEESVESAIFATFEGDPSISRRDLRYIIDLVRLQANSQAISDLSYAAREAEALAEMIRTEVDTMKKRLFVTRTGKDW